MKKTFLALSLMLLAGCGANTVARNFGGKTTINLPKGEKLVSCSWKDDDVWYLVRPFRADEQPETYQYKEKSNAGIWQGTVILIESK